MTDGKNNENRLLFLAGLISAKETLPKRVTEMLTESEPEPFWHNMRGTSDRRNSYLLNKIDTSAPTHRQTITTIIGDHAVQTLEALRLKADKWAVTLTEEGTERRLLAGGIIQAA